MEKYHPMSMPMQMPVANPAVQAPIMHTQAAAPAPSYTSPINVNASYEQINIYEKPKHHHHHGMVMPVNFTSCGIILVLYILLVIVLRGSGFRPGKC